MVLNLADQFEESQLSPSTLVCHLIALTKKQILQTWGDKMENANIDTLNKYNTKDK